MLKIGNLIIVTKTYPEEYNSPLYQPLLQVRHVESPAVVLPHVVRVAERQEPADRYVDLRLLLL